MTRGTRGLAGYTNHRLNSDLNAKSRSRRVEVQALINFSILRSYRLGDFLLSDRVPHSLVDGGSLGEAGCVINSLI